MEFTLTLNEEDLKILDEALSKMSYFKVVQIINKMNEQLSEQTIKTGE